MKGDDILKNSIDLIKELLSNPYILIPLLIWVTIFKGLALWRAARLRQTGWYIAIFIVNIIGILEIIYLIVTSKKIKRIN